MCDWSKGGSRSICGLGIVVGSEQALPTVRELDTFTEGAWDKLTKTEGGRSTSNCQQILMVLLRNFRLGYNRLGIID